MGKRRLVTTEIMKKRFMAEWALLEWIDGFGVRLMFGAFLICIILNRLEGSIVGRGQ